MPSGMRQEHDDALLSVALLTADIPCSHLLKMTEAVALIKKKSEKLAAKLTARLKQYLFDVVLILKQHQIKTKVIVL